MGKDTTVEAPDVPDPGEIAATDALYNRINTYTPFGNLTFSGPQLNNATLSLSQEQQQQLDYQNAITQNTLAEALSRQGALSALPDFTQGLDFEGLPGLADFESQGAEVEQATFDRVANLIRPQFEQDERNFMAGAAARGIDPTSALYDTEVSNQRRMRDEALQQAALGAVSAGRQEQSRLFGESLTERQQGINEQLQNIQQQTTTRGQLFNELQALLGAQQTSIPGTQSFFAPGQTDVTGAYGISQAGNQNVFNTQQQAASQKYGDTAQLVGQFAGGGK